MNKKIFIAIIMLCSLAISVHAYSVIVVVIQDDITQTKLRTTSRAIEDGLLSSFFDNGVIVSTEPIVTEPQDSNTLKKIVKSASYGRVDYILCLTVEYKDTVSDTPSLMQLSDISSFKWELYDSTGEIRIAQAEYTPEPSDLLGEDDTETKIALENLCGTLRSDINNVIERIGG